MYIKKHLNILILVFLFCCQSILAANSQQKPFGERQDVQVFIQYMVKHNKFDQQKLTELFNTVPYRTTAIQHVRHPYKENPWFKFKTVFLNQEHIKKGIEYWRANKKIIKKAAKTYQVPPEVLVAIIGIESNYGRQTGLFNVLYSLTNLAFNYADPNNFYHEQLKEFLLLCREQHIDPRKVMGSYAGAIGQLQFMPDIVRRYAVDFDHNGKIDLSHDNADVIGSIANFLHKRGWQPDTKIAVPAQKTKPGPLYLPTNRLHGHFSLTTLQQHGLIPVEPIDQKTELGIIKLRQQDGVDYWIGLHNMYVLTHYNTDVKYGMVVMFLGAQIKSALT